jgi:Ca-activated chloride channel family protein
MASDGEDHEEGAIAEAQNLEKEGIKVFTLAYGTEKGGPIPDRDPLGFLKGYKKDKSGQTILSQVHGDALREIAQAGHGSFYHAVIGGDHMQHILEDLNQLEKTEFDSQISVQYEEKFQAFLVISILLLMLELFLGERRAGFKLWKGRFEVPSR